MKPLVLAQINRKYPNFDINTLTYVNPDNARSFSNKGINNKEINDFVKSGNNNDLTQMPITAKEIEDIMSLSEPSSLLINGEYITTAHTIPFVKKNSVIIIWSILGSLLILVTI